MEVLQQQDFHLSLVPAEFESAWCLASPAASNF